MLSASSTTETNYFNQLSLHLKQYIFEYLDLVTWVKIFSSVNKDWQAMHDSISLWRSIYLNDKKSYSFFYSTITSQSTIPNLTVNQLLLNFFKDHSYNPTFVDEANSCLNSISSGKMYPGAFLEHIRIKFLKIPPYDRKTKYLELFQTYLDGFDARSCYNLLDIEIKDILSLHNLINTNDKNLTLIHFQSLIKKINSLNHLEHLLTILLIYEEDSSLNYEENIDLFVTSKWFNRLTSQDLLIFEGQFLLLLHLKKSWEELKTKQFKTSLEEKDELLLKYLGLCFEKLTEEIIFKAYFNNERKFSTFILTCPPILAKISNRNLLKLTLATLTGDIDILFACNEFRQKLILLPNPNSILNQLVNNKVNFEDEILTNSNENSGKTFAKNILSNPEFTFLLTDEQIVEFIGNRFSIDSFTIILDSNSKLVERIFSNPSLLMDIGKISLGYQVFAYYQSGANILIDRLNLSQATELALKDSVTSEHILKNKSIANQLWEPFYLDQIKMNYSYNNNICSLIYEHLKSYQQYIQGAEEGDEASLTLMLEKAITHLKEQRLSYYFSLARSLKFGLEKTQDHTVAKQLQDHHQQFLSQQSYEILLNLATVWEFELAAQLLITTSVHLLQLEREEKLIPLLLTHSHLIRQFDETPEKLINLAILHPQVIIKSYQIQEVNLSSECHLSPIWSLASQHKFITQAVIANNALRNEWLRLKESMENLLPLSNQNLIYIQKFQSCLNQLNENDLVETFAPEPEALTECPRLLARLTSQHPLIIQHAQQGNLQTLKRLTQEAYHSLDQNNSHDYLRSINTVYTGYNYIADESIRRAFFQSHLTYLVSKPYNLLISLALNQDHVAAEALFKLRDPSILLRIQSANIEQLKTQYTGHSLEELCTQWKNRCEVIKKKVAVIDNQKRKLQQIFHQLNEYKAELLLKAEDCRANNDDYGEKKYRAKNIALGELVTDLKAESNVYFNQDFNQHSMDSRQLYYHLKSKIDEHLDRRQHPDLVAHTKWKTELANYLISAIGWILAPPLMAINWMCKYSPIYRQQTATEKLIKSTIAPAIKEAIILPFAPGA